MVCVYGVSVWCVCMVCVYVCVNVYVRTNDVLGMFIAQNASNFSIIQLLYTKTQFEKIFIL